MHRHLSASGFLAVLVIAICLVPAACRNSSSGGGPLLPIAITTASLTDGVVGMPYTFVLIASGGIPPYTWSVMSGPLPNGITLNPAGALSGTPTEGGLFPLTIAVTDNQPVPVVDTAALDLFIFDPAITITTTSLPAATVGIPYAFTLTASAGQPPYTWNLFGGTLPSGMFLSPSGDLSGTATSPQWVTVTFEVTDTQVPSAIGIGAFDLLVLTAPGGNTLPDVGPASPPSPQRGLVDLPYKLVDLDGDPVTILVESSTDAGVTFVPAASGPGGQANGPIQASITMTDHLFVWDSLTDLGAVVENNVVLRIAAMDSQLGLYVSTLVFSVDNTPGVSIFVPSYALQTARMDHTATLLEDGSVLIAGGTGLSQVILATAEIFSPVTGTITTLPLTMTSPRSGHTATRLSDGRVLLVGGIASILGTELDSAEVFNPVGGIFQATSAMAEPRIGHATVVGSSGALVTGGVNNTPLPSYLNQVEQFDLAGMQFVGPPDTFMKFRSEHTATLLTNGRVLLVGGSGTGDLTGEEFDPGPGATVQENFFPGRLEIVEHASTLLPDGTVLVTGGGPGRIISSISTSHRDGFIYTSPTGFTQAGLMFTARKEHTATLLPDGRVIVAGGEQNMSNLGLVECEYYDTNNPGWTSTQPMTVGRKRHTAVLLDDGRVLITGGTPDGNTPLSQGERFHP